jgi:hypothetical protein
MFNKFVHAAVIVLVVSTALLHAQSRGQYRDFQLGASLDSTASVAGIVTTEPRTLHSRPALIQELQWRRPYPASDSVQQITFGFYNDQLSRMVVDYDRDRTAGLTDADLIEALTTVYGAPFKTAGTKAGDGVASQLEQESGTPLARWHGADYSVVLYRSSYAAGFRIVVSSPRLEALSRTAIAQAGRLDERDAPRREIERQRKEAAAALGLQEKARATNKPAFRP